MPEKPIQGSRASSLQKHLGLLTRYLKPQIGSVIWMGSLLISGIALELANPQVIRYFLDTAQTGGALEKLLLAACFYILFAIMQQGLNLAASYIGQKVGWSATNHLRADLALHCLRLDMPFHKQHTPGELIERIDGDVTELVNFFSQFTIKIIGNNLLVLGILILLFRENGWLGAGMAVYAGLTLFLIGQIKKLAVPRWAAVRQVSAEQYGFIEERISGAEEVRAAAAEPYEMRRLHLLMHALLGRTRSAMVISSLAYNLTNLVYIIGYSIGLTLAVFLYLRGEASLGTAYLILAYVGMLGDPLQNIREQVQDFQQATASFQRVQEAFDFQPLVSSLPGPEHHLPAGALGIDFEEVSFHYEENEAVLHHLNFSIKPGRIVGIIGRTGSGKSTLSRLLFRLYEPSEGSIRLEGLDLRAVPLNELRQRIGLVTQEVQIFQATLRENLTFFNPKIEDAFLQEALKSLSIWDWIQSLPHKLDTMIGANGQGISAGEAQLLAFARVFLKDPGLVILDEASSRLDLVTETLMEQSIDRLFESRTGIVIAHRLKTIERTDDIMILKDGRLIEYGQRQDLVCDSKSHFFHLLETGLEQTLV